MVSVEYSLLSFFPFLFRFFGLPFAAHSDALRPFHGCLQSGDADRRLSAAGGASADGVDGFDRLGALPRRDGVHQTSAVAFTVRDAARGVFLVLLGCFF